MIIDRRPGTRDKGPGTRDRDCINFETDYRRKKKQKNEKEKSRRNVKFSLRFGGTAFPSMFNCVRHLLNCLLRQKTLTPTAPNLMRGRSNIRKE